jgi:hypothetical protein
VKGKKTLVFPPDAGTFQFEKVLVSASKTKVPVATPPSANVAFRFQVIGEAAHHAANSAMQIAALAGR